MAGQAPRQFNPATSSRSQVGEAAPAATTSAQPYQATAAQFSNDGRALAAIGSALSGFFGTAAKTAQDVGQILHREELTQIERENEALTQQAVVDQKTGRAADGSLMGRKAYASTYKAAAADSMAFDMAEGLKAHMADMPLDGSVDPKAYAEKFYRDQVAGGSGDIEYDSRLLYSFAKSTEQQIAQHNGMVQETQETQVLQTIHQDVTRKLQHQQGITSGQIAESYTRVLAAAHGNTVVANKHFVGMLGHAIQNDGQALAVLNGLQSNGWADANPADYLKLSSDAHANTNRVKTWQAGTEVQSWHQEFSAATAQAKAAGRVLSLDEVHQFTRRAQDIDGKHGVGTSAFHGLSEAMVNASKQKAGVNAVVAAYFGLFDGTNDGGMVAAAMGEEPGKLMTTYFDPAIPFIAQRVGTFPHLMKSVNGLGLVNPLVSIPASRDFATLLASKSMQTAAPGGMSDTYKTMLGNALMGTDPSAQATAFEFFKTYQDLAGPAMTGRMFNSAESAMRFAAVTQMTKLQMDPESAFKRLNLNPDDAKVYADDGTGKIDWRKVTGKPDIKPHEFQADLTTKLQKGLRESVGRDAFFGAPNLVMGSKEEDMMLGLAAWNMRDQYRLAGSVDDAAAVAAVVDQMKTRFVTLPGQGNTMQLISDPYGGRGRAMTDPVNTIDGRKVYAGFHIKNLHNELEDPISTYRQDVATFGKAFPGMVADGDEKRVSLAPPDTVSGLHQVMGANMMPIRFGPGQLLALPGGKTDTLQFHAGPNTAWGTGLGGKASQATKLPTDPKELKAFLDERLPPGFFAVPDGHSADGTQTVYSLQYGFRVVGDEADVKRRLKAGEEAENAANRRRAALKAQLPRDETKPAIFYPSIRPNGNP